MTYDAENRLTSAEYIDSGSVVHRTEYYYSGDGMLAVIKKLEDSNPVSETRFVRSGFLPIQERDASNAVTREYTWGLNSGGGIGGLLNLKEGTNNYSYLYDGKGNVMAVLDSNQVVVASYRYDEFGNLLKKVGTFEQPFMFSTKRYDEQNGIYDFGYRFYSPAIGRWLTRDPLGESSDINLYRMVRNNPVNFVDPMGLSPVGWIIRLTKTSYNKVVPLFSKAAAVEARKQGENVLAKNRQMAKAIERANAEGQEVIKHQGHTLPDGEQGQPHYQTPNQLGHTFWGGAIAFIGSLLDPFDAISGELASDEEFLQQLSSDKCHK